MAICSRKSSGKKTHQSNTGSFGGLALIFTMILFAGLVVKAQYYHEPKAELAEQRSTIISSAQASVPPENLTKPIPKPVVVYEIVYSKTEWKCLTQALYWEVRKNNRREMEFVADAIITRYHSPEYPKTICQVIKQSGQYEFVSRGLFGTPYWKNEKKSFDLAQKIAEEYLINPSQRHVKAIAFHANTMTKPRSKYWNKLSLQKVSSLHAFYNK